MLPILRQPFPSFYPSRRGIFICVLAGLSVFFVLFVLRPFGMSKYPLESRWWIALGYGGITFAISCLFTTLLPLLLPVLFDEKKWTVSREIIFFIIITFVISFFNLLFSNWVDRAYFTWNNFLQSCIVTFSIAFIPISISVLVKQQRLFHKYKKESEGLNKLLLEAGTVSSTSASGLAINKPPQKEASNYEANSLVVLIGDNQEDQLKIPVTDLLAIQSADNYIKIYHVSGQQPQTTVFRNTLKKAEEQLTGFPHFFKCHRSYVINLSKVTNINGNAQGYKLTLLGMQEQVPVARNYNAILKEKLSLR
jgi:hypothetical protein